jgi:hypothetical protein
VILTKLIHQNEVLFVSDEKIPSFTLRFLSF